MELITHTGNQINTTNYNSLGSLNIIFWNIEGINQIANMESRDIEKLTNCEIICLYETWHEKRVNFAAFSRFSQIEVKAIRSSPKGRAKGGLILLFRRDLLVVNEIITTHQNFVIVRFKLVMNI